MFLLNILNYLERRTELIETLLFDLKKMKLFGITTDFWKNKFSSDSYLTITLHYNKDGNMKNIVLKTILVNESKTGGMYGTLNRIHFVLTDDFRKYKEDDMEYIKIVRYRS